MNEYSLQLDHASLVPRLTIAGIAIAIGGWISYAAVHSIVLAVWGNVPFDEMLIDSIKQHTILAILSIPAWFVVVRGLDGRGWRTNAIAHLIVAPIYVFAYSSIYLYLADKVLPTPDDILSGFQMYRAWYFLNHLSIYFLQFALIHMVVEAKKNRAQKDRSQRLAQLAQESELVALRSQINPHFLFNALNSISASVPSEMEQTRKMIRMLADLLRYALNISECNQVPLHDEIAFVETYLELEKHRHGTRLNYQIDVPSDLASIPVPPMSIQTLVDNSIRHGLASKLDGGTVTVRARRREDNVEITVVDDGVGLDGAAVETTMQAGVGLRNTNRRLEELYGHSSSLQLFDGEAGGLGVRFSVPIAASVVSAQAGMFKKTT